jgi:hypothetical protein
MCQPSLLGQPRLLGQPHKGDGNYESLVSIKGSFRQNCKKKYLIMGLKLHVYIYIFFAQILYHHITRIIYRSNSALP